MVEIRSSDVYLGAGLFNGLMVGVSAIQGDADLAAFNSGVMALNTGLFLNGRRDQINDLPDKTSEKALNATYNAVLKDRMADEVEEISEGEYGRRSRESTRRNLVQRIIC